MLDCSVELPTCNLTTPSYYSCWLHYQFLCIVAIGIMSNSSKHHQSPLTDQKHFANDAMTGRGVPKSVQQGRRPRICHVVGTAEGAKWMFEQLCRLRDDYGYDVAAVVSADKGKLIDLLCGAGISYYVADFSPASGSPRAMLRMPLATLKLARILRREQFDLVQSHIFGSMVIGRPAAWLADVPVRTAMIAGPFHLEAYTSRWIERATSWMETMLIPSCEKSLNLCRELGIPEHRLAQVISYSPDERRFDPASVPPTNIRAEFGWPKDTPLICLVAFFYARLSTSRWVPEGLEGLGIKGHEDLVRAAPLVLAEFPKAKFLLVGTGWAEAGEKHLEEIREMVRTMNLQESVVFAGYRSDANGILREADVAVQSSVSENLGGTIEALMMECPMVVTRVGGMVDTVRDGETGVLVDPSNPADLARGIIHLLRDPARARELGRAGRRLMLERYTLTKTVADLHRLYSRLLRREQTKRKYFSPVVSMARLALAAPVFAAMAVRLLVADIGIPIYLPIYRSRIRAIPSFLAKTIFAPFSTRRAQKAFGDKQREVDPVD